LPLRRAMMLGPRLQSTRSRSTTRQWRARIVRSSSTSSQPFLVFAAFIATRRHSPDAGPRPSVIERCLFLVADRVAIHDLASSRCRWRRRPGHGRRGRTVDHWWWRGASGHGWRRRRVVNHRRWRRVGDRRGRRGAVNHWRRRRVGDRLWRWGTVNHRRRWSRMDDRR
jgi:hypothetical protein